MFFRSKSKKTVIETHIDEYLTTLLRTTECFEAALDEYMRGNEVNDEFIRQETLIQRLESEEDEKRRKIENLMYSQGLLPESRGDILGLLESIDQLANRMEKSLRIIYVENVMLPPSFNDRLKELVRTNSKSVELSVELFHMFMNNSVKDIPASTNEIEKLESRSDFIVRKMLFDIFRSNEIACCGRVLMRDMILAISAISDAAENFSDRVAIYSVKRVF